MTAINHLQDKTGGTVELLEQLTDQQIAEQIEYYQAMREVAESAFSKWRYSREIAQAESVLAKRTGTPIVHD
jgi:hypothetical protein